MLLELDDNIFRFGQDMTPRLVTNFIVIINNSKPQCNQY